MSNLSRAVTGLLIVNGLVFLAGLASPAMRTSLVENGAFWFPDNPHFGWWQVVSYMFLHGDFGHIFFNMFALASFGTVLEREWGSGRFLLFYFLCGIGAGLIQMAVNWYEFGVLQRELVAAGMTPETLQAMLTSGQGLMPANAALRDSLRGLYRLYAAPTLGASGAIYGIMVAFGIMHPNAKLALVFVPVPIAAKFFIPVLLAIDLLSGVTGFSLFGAGVAHFAHLGGALIGFLLMLLWRNRRREVAYEWGKG